MKIKIDQIISLRRFEYFLLAIVLILGFIVRLYKINSPIADWHSWRQADTASVTRIFVDSGVSLLMPRYYDISTVQTGRNNPLGLRMVEFPVFNLIHALLVKNFQFFNLEVWGRLVSVFSAMGTSIFIYVLGNRFIGKWGGILAAFFYLLIPYNIYFTRVILPEPLAVFFATGSIVFFDKFITKDKFYYLFTSGVFLSISLLIKPFAVFYGIPIFFMALGKYKNVVNLLKDIRLVIFLDIILVPYFLWRIWVDRFPVGVAHFSWMFNGDGIRFRPAFWRWIFVERLGKLILGVWGVVPFSFGFLNTRKTTFIHSFLLGMFFYVVVVATASVRHDYYQTFVIPVISLMLSHGIITIYELFSFKKAITHIFLVFILSMMFGAGAYQIKDFYRINHPEIILAGQAVDRLTPKDAKVIAPYLGDTAFLYQTRRFGWPIVESSFDNLIIRGATHYVSVTPRDKDSQFVIDNYEVLEVNDSYLLADLTKRKSEK